MEYYSAMKKNELLIHTMTQMDLKCISLSGGSQTPFILHSSKGSTIEVENRCQGLMEGGSG